MALDVEIENIIEKLKGKVEFIQPIYEAISNSLEADASNIVVEVFHDEPIKDSGYPKISGFKIIDNGEGFTEKNRRAFCELWTTNKKRYGCKGSGRFLWLTAYDRIEIESDIVAEQNHVNFVFDKKFSKEKIIPETKIIENNKTILTFDGVTENFYNTNKKLDKRYPADIDRLCEDVKDYLLIKLFLYKKQHKQFNIEFKIGSKAKTLTSADIPNLSETEFEILSDLTNQSYKFTLYYHFFQDNENIKKGYYCANDRATEKMADNDLGFSGKLPNNDSFTILLCSDYFNDKDDDSRNGLNELRNENKHRSWILPLLFSDIRPPLRQRLQEIIKKHYPEIEAINKKEVEKAIEAAPYLASIINENSDIVKTKDSLLNDAIKEFAKRKIEVKEKFVKSLNDRSIDENAFLTAIDHVSEIALAELGEYIFYRENIIKALESALDDEAKKEDFIHDIIMRRRTDSNSADSDKHLLSNLWLLDDKFMTYSYVASDTSVDKIKDLIENSGKVGDVKIRNRPDLSIFFNREENENIKRDLIMVELKGANANKNEKNKSLTELPTDIGLVRENFDSVNSIYGYIITSIDKEFEATIKYQDVYIELYSKDDAKAYYRYLKNLNAHIFIIDLKTIVSDSFARNKTFLDILKKK